MRNCLLGLALLFLLACGKQANPNNLAASDYANFRLRTTSPKSTNFVPIDNASGVECSRDANGVIYMVAYRYSPPVDPKLKPGDQPRKGPDDIVEAWQFVDPNPAPNTNFVVPIFTTPSADVPAFTYFSGKKNYSLKSKDSEPCSAIYQRRDGILRGQIVCDGLVTAQGDTMDISGDFQCHVRDTLSYKIDRKTFDRFEQKSAEPEQPAEEKK